MQQAPQEQLVEAVVGEEETGLRLDVFLAEAIEDASRSYVKRLIKDGRVTLDGEPCTKPSRNVAADMLVEARLPPPPAVLPEPENIPLDILYEDAHLIVVNKAAGMVVHPAPGHESGTLVNAVLYHCADFQQPGSDATRPGIVHRLDRDTSGVMVVAKTEKALVHLGQQAADHAFDRRYMALVRGEFREDRGRISASIGRSLADRKRMAVTGVRGRDAVTHFEVLERFGLASLVGLQLETGRTHQIRVHLRFAGRQVLGDPVYGVTDFRDWPMPRELKEPLEALIGQALHAERLGFTHPATGEVLRFQAPPGPDFAAALAALRSHATPAPPEPLAD